MLAHGGQQQGRLAHRWASSSHCVMVLADFYRRLAELELFASTAWQSFRIVGVAGLQNLLFFLAALAKNHRKSWINR